MGTKNNPGKFDCYGKAEPDEPMFILLGRDKFAPTLVHLWSVLRSLDGEDRDVVKEAQACVAEMMAWQVDHDRPVTGLGQATLAGVFELIRAANAGVKEAVNIGTTEEYLRLLLAETSFEQPNDPA